MHSGNLITKHDCHWEVVVILCLFWEWLHSLQWLAFPRFQRCQFYCYSSPCHLLFHIQDLIKINLYISRLKMQYYLCSSVLCLKCIGQEDCFPLIYLIPEYCFCRSCIFISKLAFSIVSSSWNHTGCSLFKLSSFI